MCYTVRRASDSAIGGIKTILILCSPAILISNKDLNNKIIIIIIIIFIKQA